MPCGSGQTPPWGRASSRGPTGESGRQGVCSCLQGPTSRFSLISHVCGVAQSGPTLTAQAVARQAPLSMAFSRQE